VLILSNEHDVAVDWVVRELRARHVSYLRLNTERLTHYAVSIRPERGHYRVATERADYDLSSVRSIWYRRPERPTGPEVEVLTAGQRELLAAQWQALVLGLRALPDASWINLPHLNSAAESKLLQLRLAGDVGFSVPATLVTNSRSEALRFLADHPGGAIVKAIYAPLLEEPTGSSFVFTRRVDVDLMRDMAEAEPVPFILQEEIRPKIDIRATVVDDRVLAAAVAEPLADVDWRTVLPDLRFEPHQLPGPLQRQCPDFLRRLGIRFGAFDFALRPSGEYVFFELNPNGEWGWLQKTCGLPIAETLTDALTAPVVHHEFPG
jgi:glutathione synthase/RimK-type ligase-like ATP-grasp enzyme